MVDAMSTLATLKTEVAKLSPEERLELTDSLRMDPDVCRTGHERLKRDIQKGIDDIESGNFVTCKDDAELHAMFEGIKARVAARLAAEHRKSAA